MVISKKEHVAQIVRYIYVDTLFNTVKFPTDYYKHGCSSKRLTVKILTSGHGVIKKKYQLLLICVRYYSNDAVVVWFVDRTQRMSECITTELNTFGLQFQSLFLWFLQLIPCQI